MAKLELSETAKRVLAARYLIKDVAGTPTETPESLFLRVAQHVAAAEYQFSNDDDETTAYRVADHISEYYELMTRLDFLPNSPTLMNAGRPLGQLSGCFVLPVGDSVGEIFDAVRQAALIHQSGGGTGFSFSRLRSAGSLVKSTGGKASGPLSFIKVFDAATEAIKQGGTRRGANLGLLRVDHPDILDFIQAKAVDGVLSNFNLSVGVTDAFMQAGEKNDVLWPLIDPHTNKAVGTIPARQLFDAIVDRAHATGEPGVVFLDAINLANPLPNQPIESTNPCGEQPLLPYESCNLGSINLAHMYDAENNEIDYDRLEDVVTLAVRFLDDVITINKYPLPIIAETTLANRKIGLGVMGLADLLIKLGVPYDSDNGVSLTGEVMKFINGTAHRASKHLTIARGCFPNWKESTHAIEARMPMRNATVTTVAPTGTLSMIAGCSGGIEPIFALAYEKHVLDQDLEYIHPDFERWVMRADLLPGERKAILNHVREGGSCQGCELIPAEVQRLFKTASEIDPMRHVEMQAVVQRHVDNAVSKTINLPHDATHDNVASVIMQAWRSGCKGLTVYRDGSRSGQVLTAGTTEAQAPEVVKIVDHKDTSAVAQARLDGVICEIKKPTRRPRPWVTRGETYKTNTGCGSLYVTINHDDQGPLEVFTSMGKSGGCAASNAEAVARLVSLALQFGVPLADVRRQLVGIRCSKVVWHDTIQQLSCADALGQVMVKYDQGAKKDSDEAAVADAARMAEADGDEFVCPDCGAVSRHEGGCLTCDVCGWSKCS